MRERLLLGGLPRRPILLGGIALLFIVGLGAGWLVFHETGDMEGGAGAGIGNLGQENPAGREPGAGGASPSQQNEGKASATEGQDRASGGQVADQVAVTGPSDQQEAAKPPAELESPSPPANPEFLVTGFGPAAAPASVAGLARIDEAVVDGNKMTAEYSGGEAGEVDLLFLSVSKTQSPADAAKEAEMLLHSFPAKQLSYTWGGREIRQAMNDEGRPNQFPPLICFVWTEGQFAIRVVAAPLAPDQVMDARQAALEFIGALPY